MTLPEGGKWPPSPHGVSLAQQSLWSAWWVGDPNELTSVYTKADIEQGGITKENSFEPRYGPGLIQRAARFFWSRPSTGGGRKARLHVPLAADIATASADLLFAEPPQFTIEEGGNEAAAERVDAILNDGAFHAELVEAAEVCAALGGGWLRLVWDSEIAQRVMVDSVPADAAFGEWQWGILRAVTFFTEYVQGNNGQEVIRHLERHEPGVVLHGLYRGSKDTLGYPVPLTDHPATEGLADLVSEESAIATGVKGLTAAYVANMRPQRRWRKIEGLCELGRSDFDGVEPLMDALDECYTSWMRDIRLGKARILVPEFMLKDMGKGKGAAWDEDQEVYAQLNVAPTSEAGKQITPQQFAIRVAEHRDTAEQLVDAVLMSAGYSPSTFGLGGQGMQTATEVVSRDGQSDRTRSKKTRYWSSALTELLTTWLELDALVFKTGASGSVEVEWPEESQTDGLTLANTADVLRRAQAASTKTLVAMQHADWDEARIDEEVALILAETGSLVPDVGPLPFDEKPAEPMMTEEVV